MEKSGSERYFASEIDMSPWSEWRRDVNTMMVRMMLQFWHVKLHGNAFYSVGQTADCFMWARSPTPSWTCWVWLDSSKTFKKISQSGSWIWGFGEQRSDSKIHFWFTCRIEKCVCVRKCWVKGGVQDYICIINSCICACIYAHLLYTHMCTHIYWKKAPKLLTMLVLQMTVFSFL